MEGRLLNKLTTRRGVDFFFSALIEHQLISHCYVSGVEAALPPEKKKSAGTSYIDEYFLIATIKPPIKLHSSLFESPEASGRD